MEENFDLLAQSRANYYTKGSPIQFVKVELLKGDQSGDIAVCLSFKNISSQPVTGLLVEFKCKDRTGTVVCQDRFEYQGLNAAGGQVFGSDDAVYISQAPVGSVEVDLIEAYGRRYRAGSDRFCAHPAARAQKAAGIGRKS